MDAHVEVTATVVDRDANKTEVYAGSMPQWAWEDREHRAKWCRSRRTVVLESLSVYDGRGYRVTYSAKDTAMAEQRSTIERQKSVMAGLRSRAEHAEALLPVVREALAAVGAERDRVKAENAELRAAFERVQQVSDSGRLTDRNDIAWRGRIKDALYGKNGKNRLPEALR